MTCGQFRKVAARQGWTIESLAEHARGELDEPKRTVERILKSGPAETVIPYGCLLELYRRATTEPAPLQRGYCQDGCGQRAMGRQKFATDACRKRAARKAA